jgi:AcrR family transcriptional regulator
MPRSEEDNEQIRAQRRSEILAAATRVFVEKGVARTKVTDIAAAAGLSNGLLYHYFPSKESVFEAIALEMVTRVEQELSADRQRAIERLACVLMNRLERLAAKHIDASRVVMQAVLSGEVVSATSRKLLLEHLQGLMGRITQLIAQAQLDGDIEDDVPAEELTYVMMFLSRGMSVHVPDFSVPLPRLETLFKTLRLTPAGMRRATRTLQLERKKAAP